MIQFTQMQPETALRMAYNNDVLGFYSTSVTAPAYAEVTLGTAQPIRLYPSPGGTFYCNLSPYVTALINTKNFADTTVTDLSVADHQSFVYPASDGRLLTATLTVNVVQSSAVSTNPPNTDTVTKNLVWLAAVQQHTDYRPASVTDFQVLTPALPQAANQWYVKYWEGYPFDVCLYNTTPSLTLKNTANLQQESFTMSGACSRLFFSDGRTDVTLEDFIALVPGNNPLLVSRQGDADVYTLTVDKAPHCSGVYLKWLNNQGGYSYWLFENTYATDRSVKDLGELDRDFSNLADSFGRTTQIGRKAQDTLKLVAELLTPPQRNIVQNLLESPKVYLFTGTPFGRSNYHNWVEVSVKTNSARIKNPRQELTNLTIDIELPERYTLSL